MALFLVGAVWILSLTHTIVTPVIAAAVVASVASPLVAGLARRGVPRGVGAALVMLAIIALGVLMFVLVVGGITGQSGDLSTHLSDAKDTVAGWLEDLGVDQTTAQDAKKDASSSISGAVSALLQGLGTGITTLSSLAFFLSLTALSLFFLLKDGPTIRAWGERHLGLPLPVARTISSRSLQSLRGYFLGVTLVAGFNGIVVGLGALVLGVPLAGTIAAVTFLAAYIPIWAPGLRAGSRSWSRWGRGNGRRGRHGRGPAARQRVLQQLVQPFAMGAASASTRSPSSSSRSVAAAYSARSG